MYNNYMLYKYKVIVKLKDGIKDAKGEAVSSVINRLDLFSQNANVHVGKYFEFEVQANDNIQAEKIAVDIIEEVFINPILETYDIVEVQML